VQSKGWFGSEKTEVIAGFETKVVEMSGLEWKMNIRSHKNLSKDELPDPNLPPTYWTKPTSHPK
jgi:hypothetical protein